MTATTAPHLRDLLDTPQSYAHLVREERNFAALLYAELIQHRGLAAFLELIGWKAPVDPEQVAVFFEYAHLRDLWSHVGTRSRMDTNAAYRQALAQLVAPPPGLFDSLSSEKAFNQYFLGDGKISSAHIQMPSRWNQKRFGAWREAFGETDPARPLGSRFARDCCRLKWAFNAKPDIVIHLSPTQAICVEIKFESAESRYQVETGMDGAEGTWSLSQTQVQRYVLQELLGYRTRFVFLSRSVRKPRGAAVVHGADQTRDPIEITWAQVHQVLKSGPAASHEEDLPFAAHLWALASAPVGRARR